MNCWLYDKCNHKDCEKPFCLRKYKLDYLYNEALLSDSQKKHLILTIDQDGTDYEAFKRLANIEKHIDEFIADKQNLYIHSSTCGNGKAQPDAAEIFCETGYKPMRDILLGQKLFGEDGKLHTVIGKFDRGDKDVYKVEFQDGTSTECCGEHLWTVYDHKDKQVKTLTLEDILSHGLSYPYARSRSPLWRFDIPITNKLEITKNVTHKLDPYVLGYLLGDGHISAKSAISIAVADKDAPYIVPYINSLLPAGYICSKSANKYTYNIKLANHMGIKLTKGSFKNQLKTYLAGYTLLNTTSYTKFIPEQYKYTTIKNRIRLLQGLLDTDGTITKQAKGGCQISYSTTSKQLAIDLAFIVESLGGTCSVKERKGKSYFYKGVKKFGHPWYNCILKLPLNIVPFYLPRKKELYNQLKTHYQREPYRTIRNITYVGKKHCYCIMTDNPTHLYLTDNLIVTHNTSWGVRMLESYLDKIWAESELTCRVLFISVPRFLLASKDKISAKNDYFDHIKKYYLSADVVVWDDIGSKMGSAYEIEQLLSMIDARLNVEKTNIFTSNLNPAQMSEALGERIASRICNKSVDIELFGTDKRNLMPEEPRKW